MGAQGERVDTLQAENRALQDEIDLLRAHASEVVSVPDGATTHGAFPIYFVPLWLKGGRRGEGGVGREEMGGEEGKCKPR